MDNENIQPRSRRKQSSKKKKKAKKISGLLIALVIIILGATFGYYMFLGNTGPLDKTATVFQEIEVKKGASTKAIAKTLEQQGIIKNTLAFEHYVKKNGHDGKLRIGHYQLSASMSMETIVDQLLKGLGETIKFTIPEGYTLADIAQVLVTNNIMTEEAFWDIVVNAELIDYPFLAELPKDKHRLEGYLFPDTYLIAKGSQPETVIKAMLDRFVQVYDQLPVNDSGLSMKEVVILASLIESEARVDADRPLIASVYLNRLSQKMLLQCDATIIYAMPEHKERLLYSDYKYESPYNTYLNAGLPPTAISNPGEKSLMAAHQPAITAYFYYLWDKSAEGGHVFAETYQQHLENRKKYGYN